MDEIPQYVELEESDRRKRINGHDYKLVYRDETGRDEWEHITEWVRGEVKYVDGRFVAVPGRPLPCTCGSGVERPQARTGPDE